MRDLAKVLRHLVEGVLRLEASMTTKKMTRKTISINTLMNTATR